MFSRPASCETGTWISVGLERSGMLATQRQTVRQCSEVLLECDRVYDVPAQGKRWLLKTAGSVVMASSSVQCTGTSAVDGAAACHQDQVQKSVEHMENSIFAIGRLAGAASSEQQTSNTVIDAPGLTVEVQTEQNMASLATKSIGQGGATLTLPASIVDLNPAGQGASLLLAVLEETFYPTSTGGVSALNLHGRAVSARLVTSDGQPIVLDPLDPTVLKLHNTNASQTNNASQPETLSSSNSLGITVAYHSTLVMTFGAANGGSTKFKVKGRFEGVPTDTNFDFHATVEAGTLNSRKNEKVKVDFFLDQINLKIVVYSPASHGKILYFATELENAATTNGKTSSRRRLLSMHSASEPTVSVSSLAVAYWDTNCACWTSSPSVEITEVNEAGDVTFSSNFFGSFSLSELVVAPNPIDFGSLANFSEDLADSPYVLALHCVLLTASLLVVILLRRVDSKDTASWAYLPLLSNQESDQWHYALSIHTAMGSSRRLDIIPCLSLIGQFGSSKPVALIDGARENFKRGTTSNFVFSSNHNLGQLMEIKVWLETASVEKRAPPSHRLKMNVDDKRDIDATDKEIYNQGGCWHHSQVPEDDRGRFKRSKWRPSFCFCCFSRHESEKDLDNLDWKLDQIRVIDLNTGQRYTFLVQDWLSKVRGDGRTLRHIPALDTRSTDSGTMFDVISKQKLFDEHLWLSVARRPSPSLFTRVQRFLCAMALLYLAMLTNAMWYSGADNKDHQGNQSSQSSTTESSVIRIGTVDITYRTFYVGVVSSVIILLPALLMTCLFRKRKLRQTPGQNLHPEHQPQEPKTAAIVEEGKETHQICTTRDTSVNSFYELASSSPTVAENREGHGRFDSVNDPLWFSSQREPSPAALSTVDVDPPVLDSRVGSSRFSRNLLLVPSGRSSADSGYRTPLQSRRHQVVSAESLSSLHAMEPKVTRLLPVYPEFYNAASSDWPSSQTNFRISSAPDLSKILMKTYSDSEQKYERLCTEQYIQRKRLEGDAKRVNAQKLRPLPWWTIFIAYIVVFLSIGVSVAFTLFYSLNWGGTVSLEWMASLFFSTTAGTFLIEPLKIVFLALALSCLLKDSAEDHLSSDDVPLSRDCVKVAPDDLLQQPCKPAEKIRKHFPSEIICYQDYSNSREEKASFLPGWIPCETNCTDQAYVHTPGDAQTLDQVGELGRYSPGGYQVTLPGRRDTALDNVRRLRAEGWLDHLTRAVKLEAVVFNANTRLFTQAKVLFETPSFGGVRSTLRVESANLYPYTDAWDYVVLLLEIIFLILLLIRLCVLIHRLVCQRTRPVNRPSLGMGTVVEGLELSLGILATVIYCLKISETIQLSTSVHRDPNTYVDFSLVFLYHEIYSAAVSLALFLAILRLLGPLGINSHLYILRQTLVNTRGAMVGLGFSFFTCLVSFAIFFHLLEGPYNYAVRSVYSSSTNLLSVALSMSHTGRIVDEHTETFSVSSYTSCLMHSLSVLDKTIYK
ncbi:polycystic kidney disease protein 1-like 2 [Elysia marginata]|uniref:Polycystic kidney disease protein 1-like 2 n=1 Tax=Elysia marginata TaxID=1093978 RepID=A0AAV4GNV2_9GAST|nr:polycystic kidney disease protein 1-like 2 [Elysia marginata]